MADTKTSDEADAATLDGTELVRGVQAGGNVKMTTQAIADLASPSGIDLLLAALANGVVLSRSNISAVSIPGLVEVFGPVNMQHNTSLTSFSLPNVTSVSGPLELIGQSSMTSVDLSSLQTAGGVVNIQDNYALPTLGLAALTNIAAEFSLQGMTALASLDLSSLAIGNGISIFDCPMIESFELPALTSLGSGSGASLSVHSNGAITTISVPIITQMYTLQVYENSLLTGLEFSELAGIDNINIHDSPALDELAFPSLTVIRGGFSVHDMDVLTTISLPAIAEIDVDFGTTTGTALLSDVSIGSSLQIVTGNVVFTSCALTEASVDNILVRLAALDGTGGTTSYDNKTVTITGTSSAPSATGLMAKGILEGRGCTVTVNS